MGKVKDHLKKYIGYYFLVMASWLIFEGEGWGWFLVLVTFLKAPPFDWIGRLESWGGELSYRWGMKLRKWKEKQVKPVRILVTIICIIIIILIFWFAPECELC